MHIDHNTDPTFHLLKEIVDARPGISELVKTAQVGSDIRDELPITAFADSDRRLFPIHTEADTILSKAYATKQANVEPAILAKIDHALDMYEASLPEEATVKVAEDCTIYALPSAKQFPVKTAEDVHKAESAILRNSKKLSPESLSTAATTLVKQAQAYGLEVKTKTLALAGLVQCDLDKTAEWVEARGEAAPDGKQHFHKLAAWIKSGDSITGRADLTKLAGAIAELDAIFELQRHYGKKIPSPQETVFNTKIAMHNVVNMAGRDVPVESLMKVSPGTYGDLLGDDIVEEITVDGVLDEHRLAEIFQTLPKDMQELVLDKLSL